MRLLNWSAAAELNGNIVAPPLRASFWGTTEKEAAKIAEGIPVKVDAIIGLYGCQYDNHVAGFVWFTAYRTQVLCVYVWCDVLCVGEYQHTSLL